MKCLVKITMFFALLSPIKIAFGQNQTESLSPIFSESSLPFTIQIDVANFILPTGLQSYASAIYQGKWLLLAGRTNGLHGFDNVANNFPPLFQNTEVYVIDPNTGNSWNRSLTQGGLSLEEIDCLSVTAPESFQKGDSLFVVGGYGVDSASGQMGTKSTLTEINLPIMIEWVINGKASAKKAIRQVSHPLLQVTGGSLFQLNDHQPMLLILGQDFEGLYRGGSNGIYTKQIRPFWLVEKGQELAILAKYNPKATFPDYRRRDLNVLPILQNNQFAYVAFAGVFTVETGVWTVPITIFPDGSSIEANPNDPNTFKQAMNHYNCPVFGLYSVGSRDMFALFPGGISFGYFSGGVFTTDPEIPFINQVTTIKIDKNNVFTQYLMGEEYPFIASTGSNPGNQLLFGAEAVFFPKDDIPLFANGVIQFDALPKRTPTVVGYIVGGIMSTLPNTNVSSDSTASPYVFKVSITPR